MMRKALVSCLLLLATRTVGAEVLVGRVVGIVDGDTLTLLDAANQRHRLHLAGIAAPGEAMPYGDRAKANLSALAFGKAVEVNCAKADRNGARLCKLFVNGTDINLEQVSAGLAWAYRRSVDEQGPDDQAVYQQAEFQAKIRRLGLWGDKNPVPPWAWRRNE